MPRGAFGSEWRPLEDNSQAGLVFEEKQEKPVAGVGGKQRMVRRAVGEGARGVSAPDRTWRAVARRLRGGERKCGTYISLGSLRLWCGQQTIGRKSEREREGQEAPHCRSPARTAAGTATRPGAREATPPSPCRGRQPNVSHDVDRQTDGRAHVRRTLTF